MAIELVEKYLPYVDEQFTEESKKEYLTNTDLVFPAQKRLRFTRSQPDQCRTTDGSRRETIRSSRVGMEQLRN